MTQTDIKYINSYPYYRYRAEARLAGREGEPMGPGPNDAMDGNDIPKDKRVASDEAALQKGLEDLERDLGLAKNDVQRARIKRDIANVLSSQGKLREAREVLNEAVAILRKTKAEPDDLIMGLVDLAKVTWRIGELDKGEELAREALKLVTPLGVKGITKGYASWIFGTVRHVKGDHEEAATYLDRALALFESAGHPEGIALTCHNIANLYMQRCQFGKALAYYNRSVKINEELGKKQDVMGSMVNMAISKREQGLYFDALKIFNTTADYFKPRRDVRTVAIITTNTGHTYLSMRRWDDALTKYDESSTLCEMMGERWIESYNTFARSEAFLGKGELHKAEDNMKLNFDGLVSCGSEEIKGRTLRVRGMIFRERGEPAKAEKDFALAEKTLTAGSFETYLALLYVDWAKSALLDKDRGRAKKLFRSARDIYVRLKLPLLERGLNNTMKQYGL
jgi:tetratricopeptide (TPR) repeat protein